METLLVVAACCIPLAGGAASLLWWSSRAESADEGSKDQSPVIESLSLGQRLRLRRRPSELK